jgi:NAD(P)-dependent dehydrogenase (short-subunit alcohol dehydrogenase family)
MDLQLNDKVILVSGGAKGIGEAVCKTLANEGAIPVIVDKDEVAGEKLRERLNGRAYFIKSDIISAEACSEVITKLISLTGSLYGIVNNAGVNDGVGLKSGSPVMFITSLNNNVGHYYYLTHFALPHLIKSKGAIVNVSSKTALTGQGGTSGYVAAKGAILSLTREWAVELLEHNIRVNAVVPAEVWTPMYESWIKGQKNPEEKLKSVTNRIPFQNRMTTPEEIADTVVFLLSSRASHITGEWMHVDGGYVHLDRAIQKD